MAQKPTREHEFPEFPILIDTGGATLLESCRSAYPIVGVVAAVEAINIATDYSALPPEWATDAITKHFQKPTKAKIMLRVDAAIRDLERWEKVSIGQLHEFGTDEKCIENAVQLLAKEGKAVDSETVRKSYYKVQKRLKISGDERLIYWIVDRIRQRYETENS